MMLKLRYILLLAAILALPLLTKAQDTVVSDSVDVSISQDLETSDVVSDDSDWYVEPVIPEALRSPMRTAAANCLTDSTYTFDQDSVLVEISLYDYDAAGRTIRTTVMAYNSDGPRSGKSKLEYGFDNSGTQIYTATYAWDNDLSDWIGTEKYEFVYNEAHKMESNISYVWVGNVWLPLTAYTYSYDASGREIEFTTYNRNASLNRLVPSKQRLQTWYNASKKTQEINYTAYANGAWSAGTRKDYQYDAKGNQIEYTYYASYSGGNWVGSTHELWTYNAANKKTYYEKQTWTNGAWANSSKEVWEFNSANKQTLHEKYSGSGTNWTITLREISGYDDAGNNTLVENYSYTNGVAKGSKKEEYTFNAAKKKINTYKYKWVAADNAWVYNTWAVSDYDAAGNAIETANYSWTNNAWKGTGTRTLKTYNGSKKVTVQITQTWPSGATDWVNATRKTTTYQGAKTTQEASYTWQNEAWVGTSRSDWHYNAAGQNDTIKTYTNNGTDWIYSNRTVNTYDSRGNNILTHNAQWNGTRWVMTSMNRLDVLFDSANRKTLNATYICSADSVWHGIQKDTTAYTSSGLPLYTVHFATWSNNDWEASYKVEYAYDQAGRKTLEQRFDLNSGVWEGRFRYEYNYDSAGHQLLNAIYLQWNFNSNTWIGSSKTERVYSSTGLLMVETSYSWRGNDWEGFSRSTYQYDSSNREIQRVIEGIRNGGWANVEKTEKEFIGSRQVKNNAYVWLNNQWMYSSRNESVYDSDSQAKLRRQITGSWYNGALQSYSDNLYFYSCDAPADNNGAQPRTPTELEEIDENYDTNVQPFDPMLPTYNLQGQSVDPATYHGIVIQNGHTYLLP